MNKKIMRLPLLLSISALFLSACGGSGHDDGDTLPSQNAPYQVGYASPAVYSAIKSDADAAAVFQLADAVAGSSDLCDVKIMRMVYDTVGGAGEAATSSGVVMMPQATGTNANCTGDRPTVLYAHGTEDDSRFDLSQFIADSDNPSASEATILLAFFASRGYNVIAPNYAGYADSSLNYHPYLDEKQQSTEMINALDHVKTYSADIGINMSADLFISGLSQGGYVAMATHKALQAKGETVRASVPISGPYAMLDFVDTVFAGYVNGGSTLFAPMLLTAMDKANDVYTNPSEVYSSTFATTAEDALPRSGGHDAAVAAGLLPERALFTGTPPVGANLVNQAGFGSPALISDAFRNAYLLDIQTNGANPVMKARAVVKDADLRNWTPTTPVMMCGTQNDPIVYFSNTTKMASHWAGVPTALSLNLDADPTSLTAPLNAFAAINGAWQLQFPNIQTEPGLIHGLTGVYCGGAALGFFQSQRTQ